MILPINYKTIEAFLFHAVIAQLLSKILSAIKDIYIIIIMNNLVH
jgi:hypothetical protein